ncbi:MAG: diiron oxygenase [Bacteroidia bacterium]
METLKSTTEKYHSTFIDWDTKSYVRSKPHSLKKFKKNKTFFSQKLAFLFKHPEVINQSQKVKNELLVYHLYNYIEFTVWLELGPVNEVCDLIRKPSFLPWLPSTMKDDALKIYVDEGGHAEMAHALRERVLEFTNLKPFKFEPSFLQTLNYIIESEPKELTNLIKVFFVIISETLITGTLSVLPNDESVQISVREFARDHAMDEGKHHAYFRQLFEYLFARLPREMKIKIGRLLPKMILAFLKPDSNLFVKILERFPKQFPYPSKIVEELLTNDEMILGIKASAKPTIAMLRYNSVFEYKIIEETFKEYNLI